MREGRAGSTSRRAEEALDGLLLQYPAPVRELVSEARTILRKWLPGAEETVDSSARMLAYAYGPGYRGLVCTLLLSQSGVKLGLNKGADLKDPQGLLRGSGKVHRHVQLRNPNDLKQTGLKSLVDAARVLCQERLKS